MAADPFAGRILVGGMTFRRAADQAELGRIDYRPGDPLPFRPIPFRRAADTPDPTPTASLEEALAVLDALAPPLPPGHLPVVLVARQPCTTLAAYADGRVLDGLFRGNLHGHDRPPGSGKQGRIVALLHRHRRHADGTVGSADEIAGVKRLPDGKWWAWYDAGGRRLPNPRLALDWIHDRHLEAAGASAHARLAFEGNRTAFLDALVR